MRRDGGRQAPALTIALGAVAAGVVFVVFMPAVFGAAGPAVPTVERGSVWTERVRRGQLLRQVAVQGTLVPKRVEWLSATSAANVARIAVRPGAEVQPDTVVVELENTELELAAREAERQAASAASELVELDVRTRAELDLLQATLASLTVQRADADHRARMAAKLAGEGLMSDLDHRGAEAKAQGLSARVEAEHARKDHLESGRRRQLAARRVVLSHLREIAEFRREQLALLRVRAGVRGVVQEIPLEKGMWVTTGSVLARVAAPGGLKARATVAQGHAKDVHPGLGVHLAMPEAELRGRVERVGPAVRGGNVELDIELVEPPPAGARVDQPVTGYVEIERLDDVVFVTRPVGVRDESSGGVFRLEADGVHARHTTAKFGRGSVGAIEVLEGLVPGDEIVVSDVSGWGSVERVRIE